ncbi:MAG: cache domain-containing protein [Pseudomonadota bacterium]
MNLRLKVLLLAIIPLVLALGAVAYIATHQSSQLARQEIDFFEKKLIEAKQAELLNYVALALTSIDHLYKTDGLRSAADEAEAQRLVKQVLDRLTYGTDGYFFVYDERGNNLVHPKQTWRVGKNYWDLEDENGLKVIQRLIDEGQGGGGFVRYAWEQPSTGDITDKIGYAVYLDRWKWMLGTGIYIDDVTSQVNIAKEEVDRRISETFMLISLVAFGAVVVVFGTGIAINIHETRLADGKLQALNEKIVATQEEERSRVARELHDSISQILVSVKFALEQARLKFGNRETPASEPICRAEDNLNLAIREVRRISHDLRPGILDDLGLSKALENLAEEFSTRTGVDVDVETTSFKNLLRNDAKTALYRIAQEALTNIERHAKASKVDLGLLLNRNEVTLRIADNGQGFGVQRLKKGETKTGIGLKNMKERLQRLDGALTISSTSAGTVIEAKLPHSVLQRPSRASSRADMTAESQPA